MSDSDIIIGIDFTECNSKRTKPPGNKKHNSFIRKQQFLRRKQRRQRNQGPEPRLNGTKPEHRPLPSTAAGQHSTSSSHRQGAEPASTSGFPSLTITVKNAATNGWSRKINNTDQSRKIPNTDQSQKIPNTEQSRKSTPLGNPPKPAPYAAVPLNSSAYGNPQKYVAIDCEMVGTGPKGRVSELARCSVVSYDGDVVYDKYVKPANPVTDLRTRWSGITWSNLHKATPFADARKEILRILSGKVVIGHAIHNDFRALGYGHPADLTRDTSRIPLLNHKAGFAERECASLKRLTKAIFNRDIQTGKRGHSSVEDAKATMELYKVVEAEWEGTLAAQSRGSK